MNTAISIIIPTFQRYADLSRCLEALLCQLPSGERVEILVCDDGEPSEARSMMSARFPVVTWLQGPRRGPAANRNLGARSATGEWLLFIDDDCVPVPHWLDAYRETMPRAAGMTALCGATWRIGEPRSLLWEAPHNPDGALLISCNLAIRKQDFWEVGGFDERYPMAAFEDSEFEARFLRSRGRSEFVSAARVDHPLRQIPAARKLARRWEARVIFALDQGAAPWLITFRLPWHVMRVTQACFRRQAWSAENGRALWIHLISLLYVICWTPGWVKRWAQTPRSDFWTREIVASGPVPGYGF